MDATPQSERDPQDPTTVTPQVEQPSAAVEAAEQSAAVPRPNRQQGLSGQSEEVLMAMNLYAEGRGEYVRHGADALYAIGRVVMNRARSRHFPGTPSSVILQRSQFSWTRTSDPNYQQTFNPTNAAVWEACVNIAREVLSGGGGDPAPGADHYHANYVSPDWANRRKLVATIGAHLFYDLVSDDNAAGPGAQDDQPMFRTPREWTPAPSLEQIQRPQSAGGRVLRLGHFGPAVAEVQRLLSLEDDGYFGADTAEAVFAFKQGHGLGEAERVGATTWALLMQTNGGGRAEEQSGGVQVGGQGQAGAGAQGQGQGQVEQPTFQPPRAWTEAPSLRAIRDPASGATLQIGHFGPAVAEVQRLLMIKDDGYFGVDTARVVYAFKQQHSLGEGERVGATTYQRLLEVRRGVPPEGQQSQGQGQAEQGQQGQAGQQGGQGSRWIPAPALEQIRAQQAVLDYRMEGDAVSFVQRLLLIEADGKYGDDTRTAVRQFKAQQSLGGGDQVGWFTLQRLEEVAAERGNISADSSAQMARILAVAQSRAGSQRPGGWCYRAVSTYIDATGYGRISRGGFGRAIPSGYWSYARQFADYLNMGDNARRLGIKRLAINNPYEAPAGAIVVVAPRSPGTSHPTAGDISIAGGDGTFYNDGNMSYRGREAWPPAHGGVLGIYVPDL